MTGNLPENKENATAKHLRKMFKGFEVSSQDLGGDIPFELNLDGDEKTAIVLEAGEHFLRIVAASGRTASSGAKMVEFDLETFDRVPVACDSLLLNPRADNDSSFAKKRARENRAVLTAIIKACGLAHHLPGNVAPALAEMAGKELLVVVAVESGRGVLNVIRDARAVVAEKPSADESASAVDGTPSTPTIADEVIGVII